MKIKAFIFLFLFSISHINAQTIDGILGMGEYPAVIGTQSNPISIQAVQTQFGDNLNMDPIDGGGSELDAMYINYDATDLYIFLAGNLEPNFNKIEVFIDSKAGGQDIITPINPVVDPLSNGGAGALINMVGLTFDVGFEPDYYFTVGHGDPGGGYRFGLHYGELGILGSAQSMEDPVPMTMIPNGSMAALNNSNVIGVQGGTGPAVMDPTLVNTGLELKIPLSVLQAGKGDEIKILAFVDNGDHNFASNQFLGPLTPPQGNLGGDGFGNFNGNLVFDLNTFPGDQFSSFTIPDDPFVVTSPTQNSPSLPFIDPGYMPDGTFSVGITDGASCPGTAYTITVTPVTGSGPGLSTPPFPLPNVIIGATAAGSPYVFSQAGPGDYTVSVQETGSCIPATNPEEITVTVPDQTYDDPFTIVETSVMTPSLPFSNSSYFPDGTFEISIIDGASCTGFLYDINITPVPNSAPDGSTPPTTNPSFFTAVPAGGSPYLFSDAGVGLYTVDVFHIGPCILATNPDSIVVEVPDLIIIPTMSQWGVIILALLLACIGVLSFKFNNQRIRIT